MPISPAQRSLLARSGAYAQHAKHDVRDTTRAARDAFLRRFENEVDPRRELPEAERTRRALAARKAHMSRLALRSAKARARRSV